jgi:WD40 repeat protein
MEESIFSRGNKIGPRDHVPRISSSQSSQYITIPFNFDNFSLDCELIAPNHTDFKEILKCSICLNIYIEPRMCGKCQIIYCKKCIYKWINEKNGKCPTHGSEFIDSDLTIPHKNMLNAIQFKCPSLSSQCKFLTFEKLKLHLENCRYLKLDLKCIGCGVIKKLEGEMINHLPICPEMIINCRFCNLPIKRKTVEAHKQQCFIKCNDCDFEVPYWKIKTHLQNECNKKVLENFKSEQKKLNYEVNHFKSQCKLYEDEIERLRSKVSELEGVVTEYKTKEVSLFNKRQKKLDKIEFIKNYVEHEDQVSCIVRVNWKRDNDTFISGSWDFNILVWNVKQEHSLNTLLGHEDWVTSLCYIEWEVDDVTLVSGGADSTLKVWNFETGECIKTLIGHEDWISSIEQLKSSNNQIITSSHDRMIKLWDIQSGCCLRTIHQEGKINTMNLLTYNNVESLLCSLEDYSIKLVDLNKGNILKSYTGHGNEVCCYVKLSETLFATGSKDKSIKVWNIEKAASIRSLVGHNDFVTGLLKINIADNELHVLSCSQDRNIKVWNADNGVCVITFNEHYLGINSLFLLESNFSDIYIISGGDDNIISYWKI